MQPWRPPFHAPPAARKGPISSKRVSSQNPLLRKFGNFSLYSLNFHPNFSSQAPKFQNFQLTSPQIWKFLAHKPPNLEIFRSQVPPFQRQMSVRKPHTSEIRAAHPYLKKSWVPPRARNSWFNPHTPQESPVLPPKNYDNTTNVYLCVCSMYVFFFWFFFFFFFFMSEHI